MKHLPAWCVIAILDEDLMFWCW